MKPRKGARLPMGGWKNAAEEQCERIVEDPPEQVPVLDRDLKWNSNFHNRELPRAMQEIEGVAELAMLYDQARQCDGDPEAAHKLIRAAHTVTTMVHALMMDRTDMMRPICQRLYNIPSFVSEGHPQLVALHEWFDENGLLPPPVNPANALDVVDWYRAEIANRKLEEVKTDPLLRRCQEIAPLSEDTVGEWAILIRDLLVRDAGSPLRDNLMAVQVGGSGVGSNAQRRAKQWLKKQGGRKQELDREFQRRCNTPEDTDFTKPLEKNILSHLRSLLKSGHS